MTHKQKIPTLRVLTLVLFHDFSHLLSCLPFWSFLVDLLAAASTSAQDCCEDGAELSLSTNVARTKLPS